MARGSRRKDKKQQEEGQEAAGGRTRSSKRKDKRQPTTCPSSCYKLSFLFLIIGSPGAHILCPFVLNRLPKGMLRGS